MERKQPTRTWYLVALGGLVMAAAALSAQSRPVTLSPASDFRPDTTFAGSSLAGWRPLGDADWRAENGEIIGTPRAGGSGGWLLLDRSYASVYLFSRFRCAAGCKGGLMFRVTGTADGGKTGILVSLDPADLHIYKLTIDAQGKEKSRTPLGTVTAFVRVVPRPAPNQQNAPSTACGGGGAGRGGGTRKLPFPLPELEPPPPGIQAGEWNSITVSVDADVVRPWLNGNIDFCGVGTDDRDAYGPVAFYSGGSGEIRYKDVSFKDLTTRVLDAEVVSPNFRMQRLDDFSYAWGAAVADFNRDGQNDVVAGPWIYYGPTFTTRHEMYVDMADTPGTDAPNSYINYAFDFTGDGWPDVLSAETRALHLYVNPRGENRHWSQFFVLPQVSSEASTMEDLDGDGRPELIFGMGTTIAFAGYDPANPTAVPWTPFAVSEAGLGFGHAIGVGDINGDGRKDILQTAGWWEQPAGGLRSGLWAYHPVAFGRWGHSEGPGGSVIAVYDVNGDKLNDVVTGLNAHGFGLAWFEQKRAASGDISFVRHMIMDDFSTQNAGNVTFSELHASNMADMTGDGIPDYITGKRVFSHRESYVDPDPLGPGVLYVYRTVRNPKAPGGAEFVPELVHNRSGVGSEIAVADINKDGLQDIVTSTARGTFIFFGQKRGR